MIQFEIARTKSQEKFVPRLGSRTKSWLAGLFKCVQLWVQWKSFSTCSSFSFSLGLWLLIFVRISNGAEKQKSCAIHEWNRAREEEMHARHFSHFSSPDFISVRYLLIKIGLPPADDSKTNAKAQSAPLAMGFQSKKRSILRLLRSSPGVNINARFYLSYINIGFNAKLMVLFRRIFSLGSSASLFSVKGEFGQNWQIALWRINLPIWLTTSSIEKTRQALSSLWQGDFFPGSSNKAPSFSSLWRPFSVDLQNMLTTKGGERETQGKIERKKDDERRRPIPSFYVGCDWLAPFSFANFIAEWWIVLKRCLTTSTNAYNTRIGMAFFLFLFSGGLLTKIATCFPLK